MAKLILFIVILLFIVFGSPKLKINMGIPGIFFACIVGKFAAGMSASQVAGLFPANLAIVFILATAFFGYASRTGIFKTVSQFILYRFRRFPAFIPFAILIATFIISALGAGGYATPAIMSPIAFQLAAEVGFAPVLAAFAVFVGATTATILPYMVGAVIERQNIGELIGDAAVDKGLILHVLIFFVIVFATFILQYFITGSYKCKGLGDKVIEKPEPLNGEQKKALYVIVGFIILAAVPSIIQLLAPNPVTAWYTGHIEIQTLMAIGIVIFNLMGVAKFDDILKENVPWGLILMLGGVGMYVKLLQPMGGVDIIVAAAQNVPVGFIHPILLLSSALLGAFCDGGVAISALVPVYSGVVAAFPQLPELGTYLALTMGKSLASCSPFSTGGAMSMLGCEEPKVRESIVRRLIVNWIIVIAIGFIVAALGLFKTIS